MNSEKRTVVNAHQLGSNKQYGAMQQFSTKNLFASLAFAYKSISNIM